VHHARRLGALAIAVALLQLLPVTTQAQEAYRRWQILRTIRQEKFDQILPGAMRDAGIDMWIVAIKEGNFGPLWEDLGRGYWGGTAYFVFTDKGKGRVERAVFGPDDREYTRLGAYDLINPPQGLAAFVKERDPKRIGVDMSDEVGPADDLTHTLYAELSKAIGPTYAARLVSAEKVVANFQTRRTASEIVAFGEVCELARRTVERALSNEVITPGKTTLDDVAWWMEDEVMKHGASVEFDHPSVTILRPDGTRETSTDAIITRGSVVYVDWGVHMLNFGNDMKRFAYVLKEGETTVPAGVQHAFDEALKIREIVRGGIRPGKTGSALLEDLHGRVRAAGYEVMKLENFRKPGPGPKTEVIIGCHATGNTGHGSGAGIVNWQPVRSSWTIEPNTFLSIEFFSYTAVPEWGGRKLQIALEDDALVTDQGPAWLVPPASRVLVIG
jgi:Xaa-Pro aminopeptidase